MPRYSIIAVLLFQPLAVIAQGPSTGIVAAKPDLAGELSASLRNLLLLSLPEPLYEDNSHWGGQKMVTRRIRLKNQDGAMRLEAEKKPTNDGIWWKVRVTADRPKETLQVLISDLKQSEPGKLTFSTRLAMDTHVDYDKQKWAEGTRLWGAGLKARVRIKLTLPCEVTANLQNKGALLPEVVFRLRVLGSEVGYDNVKVEHVAGIGGDGAKLLGGKFLDAMRQWRPSLERKLVEKANASIFKAGDTKEIRIGLFGVMKQ